MKLQLTDTTPRLIKGAFGGAYSKYRINGVEGMDLPTFFSKMKNSISSILKKETTRRAICSQTTTWIRFTKGNEYVNLAFNSRMAPVYMLNDINNIVRTMINHIEQQVENPSPRDSNNNKKRSHTQLDSRKQVIAFQDRVITINIKEAQHPLK